MSRCLCAKDDGRCTNDAGDAEDGLCLFCRTHCSADDLDTIAKEYALCKAERDRMAVALWNIRMKTERWSVDDDATTFANVIIHEALAGLGSFKQRAQDLAAGVSEGDHAE